MTFTVAAPSAFIRLKDTHNDDGDPVWGPVVQLGYGDTVPDEADLEHHHNQDLIDRGALVERPVE